MALRDDIRRRIVFNNFLSNNKNKTRPDGSSDKKDENNGALTSENVHGENNGIFTSGGMQGENIGSSDSNNDSGVITRGSVLNYRDKKKRPGLFGNIGTILGN